MNSPDARTAAARSTIAQNFGELPLRFEPNAGQTQGEVRFLSRGPGYTLFLTTGDQAVLSLKKPGTEVAKNAHPAAGSWRTARPAEHAPATPEYSVLRMSLLRANPDVRLTGLEELPGKVNYFIGNDPKQWRTHLPTYAKVKYTNVYPGVDLVYYGNQSGQLEYDFAVAPGADASAIALNIQSEGHSPVRTAANGDLLVRIDGGDAPAKAGGVPGRGRLVGIDGKLALRHGHFTPVEQSLQPGRPKSRAFALGAYDHTKPLYIDPVVYYSTFLGGTVSDVGYGVAVDNSGDAYITGATSSPSFPSAHGALNHTGAINVYVTELNPTGNAALYYTYLGGSGIGSSGDTGYGITVDPAATLT